jgi:acetyl esterase/lipase
MQSTRLFALLLLLPVLAGAQSQPEVIPLWPNGAPGFEDRRNEPEQAKDWWVRNVHNPSLTVFPAAAGTGNGCAIIVAPGGGFRELVFNAEGKLAAQFLNGLGVTVFVLKYRLPFAEGSPYTLDHVRQDAYRAMRLVRSRARDLKIDPNRIGLLGFSAGGALATMVTFDKGDGDARASDPIDRLNGRPNLQLLIYPGGKVPASIPGDSPPAFLLCADDDEYGSDDVTMELAAKFRAAKVPVEVHLLARGKHAFNMGDRSSFASVKGWPQRMADWLGDSGYLRPMNGEPK